MADSTAPLTPDERAELEALRAEKAQRQQDEQARKEREELARLKHRESELEMERPDDWII